MTDLIVVPQVAHWQRLKRLVLDSVSSPITRRVYNLGLDEFFAWYPSLVVAPFVGKALRLIEYQRNCFLLHVRRVFVTAQGDSHEIAKASSYAITLTATTSGVFNPNHFKRVDVSVPPDSEFWLQPGDLLFQRGNTREYVGIAAYYNGERGLFLYPDLMMKVRVSDKLSLPYVHLCATAPPARAYFSRNASGAQSTMPKINQETLLRLPIALPPAAEQRRIVAKVDELMSLCDRLEAARTERESRRDRLAAASLHRLNRSADTEAREAFREHARFYLNHLPRLTTCPEQIKQLHRSILNLAVRGQLVPQDLGSQPTLQLLLAASDRARSVVAEEDRRADSEMQSLLAAELRWAVPSSWKWRGLADLVLFIDYRGNTPVKVERGVRLITAKNVRKGFVSRSPEEFVSEETYRTWMTRGFPRNGDVLFTTEAPMGNAAVVRSSEDFALAQRVICFRPYGAVDSDFLVLQLIAEPFQSVLDAVATGLTAKGIKAAKLKRLPIAVPPLAEQRRIVAKVNELTALSDQLETQLTTAQTESRRLLEAVLHKALATATPATL